MHCLWAIRNTQSKFTLYHFRNVTTCECAFECLNVFVGQECWWGFLQENMCAELFVFGTSVSVEPHPDKLCMCFFFICGVIHRPCARLVLCEINAWNGIQHTPSGDPSSDVSPSLAEGCGVICHWAAAYWRSLWCGACPSYGQDDNIGRILWDSGRGHIFNKQQSNIQRVTQLRWFMSFFMY